ncbi:MAG: hypothetical protein ACFB22_09105 [Rhodothalassiaceae bacterium]
MRVSLFAAAVAAASALPAQAQQEPLWPRAGKFAFSVIGGAEFTLANDFSAPLNFTTSLPALVDGSVVTIEGVDVDLVSFGFDGIYGATTDAGLEVSYGLTEAIELYVAGQFQNATGGFLVIGNITGDPTPGVAGGGVAAPVTASLSRFRSYNVDAGARYYFLEDRLRPFIGVHGGVQFVEGIDLTLSAPNPFASAEAPFPPPFAFEDIQIFEASTEFFGGVDVGFFYAFADNWGFAVEVGFRWTSEPDVIEGAFLGTPFDDLAVADSRLSIPIGARLQYRF